MSQCNLNGFYYVLCYEAILATCVVNIGFELGYLCLAFYAKKNWTSKNPNCLFFKGPIVCSINSGFLK